jgi:hypothetical protein
MSLKITYEQNFLVTDFYLLKLLLVALGFGSQAFICGFSRQNICSVQYYTSEVGGSSVWQISKKYFAGVIYGHKALMC